MINKAAIIEIESHYEEDEKQRLKNMVSKDKQEYTGEGISNHKRKLAKSLERIIWIIKKVEWKVDNDYVKRGDKDVNKIYMYRHMNLMRLYYQLKYNEKEDYKERSSKEVSDYEIYSDEQEDLIEP